MLLNEQGRSLALALLLAQRAAFCMKDIRYIHIVVRWTDSI
jgi:hypothetical protein